MKITDIRATTVTVPLEAPLRHANGCHWGRFVRTIVEVEADNGLIGLGEMGGGGESAEAVFRAMKSYLVGHDPARTAPQRVERLPRRAVGDEVVPSRDVTAGEAGAGGEFGRAQIDKIRRGVHGARSTRQAIAIGLSEARKKGKKVPTKKAS